MHRGPGFLADPGPAAERRLGKCFNRCRETNSPSPAGTAATLVPFPTTCYSPLGHRCRPQQPGFPGFILLLAVSLGLCGLDSDLEGPHPCQDDDDDGVVVVVDGQRISFALRVLFVVVVLRKDDAAWVGTWKYFLSAGSVVRSCCSSECHQQDMHSIEDLIRPSGERVRGFSRVSLRSRSISW
jgi:hypothetical protein